MLFWVLSLSDKLNSHFNLLRLHRDLLYVNLVVILRLKLAQFYGQTRSRDRFVCSQVAVPHKAFPFPNPYQLLLAALSVTQPLHQLLSVYRNVYIPWARASFSFSSFPFLRACPFVLVFDTSFLTSLLAIPLRIVYKIMMSTLSFPLFKKHWPSFSAFTVEVLQYHVNEVALTYLSSDSYLSLLIMASWMGIISSKCIFICSL